MDGLILLIIILPVIFLILLIRILSVAAEQRRTLAELSDKVTGLGQEISQLTNELKDKTVVPPVKKEVPVQKYTQPPVAEVPVVKPVAETPVETKPVTPVYNTPPAAPIEHPFTKKPIEDTVGNKQEEDAELPYTVQSNEPGKGRDLEKFIGENLANKIGITVLVLGIGFFIKYAIDKNWIGETGRVVIGLLCGVILMGFAHYLRNTYRSFSSVLVGGGLSVFYFSVAFAFHQYELIGQTEAFIFMVIISGLGVVLSIYYNRQELAILATIGAFITPFLVSTGKENHVALFTYLCIVNTGLMVLTWFKRWPAINSIALFFTTFIFGGWIIKHTVFEEVTTLPLRDALLFATLFYLLFVAMNILNSIRLKTKFTRFDFLVLLSVNALYYGAGILILDYWSGGNFKGLFTGALGIFNLVLAFVFYRKPSVDRNFVTLLIGLSISFISLVAPVQFEGNHVVLFWAAECVILLWLSQRTGIVLLRHASALVVFLMLITLFGTWEHMYFSDKTVVPVVLNKGFVTGIVVAISLFIYHKILRSFSDILFVRNVKTEEVKKTALVAAIITAYTAGVLEIWYQFDTRYTTAPLYNTYIQLYTYVVAIFLLWIYRRDPFFPVLKFLFTCLCFALYFFSADATYNVSVSLVQGWNGALFLGHWLSALLLLWLLYDLVRFFFRKQNSSWQTYSAAFTWLAATGIVILLSIELYHINLWSHYRSPNWAWWENLYYKAGLSIIWGLCSFTMMWLGMKKNFKPLRIFSLTLFTVTLIKLFAYDILNIPAGGKIAAFILLGVLLLAISFMYQRLKKIIID